ncbi:MAG TPA: ATP-binding cassette domain-containing protein [Mycobacteriales bacterium]|nr:ATP-binding cassette domain-containing protein [Mycobacteriales bacterium]
MTSFAQDLYLLLAAYGLALPVSYAGLPVLSQGAFVAVGAFGTALLAAHGAPLGVAVLAATALAGVAGYVVGFAATRLAGASLALATWGLAWLAYVVLTKFPAVSGGSQGLLRPTPARLVSPSLGVVLTMQPWLHVVAAGVLCVVAALAVRRAAAGPWGLDWAALRTSPVLADSLGVPVQRRRRALLSAGAAIGALAGAGTGVLVGVVAPADYSPLLSLQLFVAVLVGGTATWWGPAIGVALLAALPSASDGVASAAGIDPLRAQGVLTAVLLIAALALRGPVGRRVPAVFERFLSARRSVVGLPSAPDVVPTHPAGVVLALTDVHVRYGAVQALDGVQLELRAGEVHALVGPNGSGKSTALRVAAGVVAPDSGDVRIRGAVAPVAGNAAPRVQAGVVRTLQRTAMLGELTAATQVAIGVRATEQDVAGQGWRHLFGTPLARRLERRRSGRALAALTRVGLSARSDVPAVSLDSAEQRLLQIARATATGATALLLDEPAAGMSQPQRVRLGEVLRSLARAGHGVLLVEHDMALVGRVADRVTVLAEGRVLASGAPDDVRADPEVQRAYLGDVTDPRHRREEQAPA